MGWTEQSGKEADNAHGCSDRAGATVGLGQFVCCKELRFQEERMGDVIDDEDEERSVRSGASRTEGSRDELEGAGVIGCGRAGAHRWVTLDGYAPV